QTRASGRPRRLLSTRRTLRTPDSSACISLLPQRPGRRRSIAGCLAQSVSGNAVLQIRFLFLYLVTPHHDQRFSESPAFKFISPERTNHRGPTHTNRFRNV